MNTHQALKLLALVMMTVDHIGAFVYPDELWWRALGRFLVPVWFFLIGHALHYRTSKDLMLWAAAMALINPFMGLPFFPLNALVTIICCQWLLRLTERRNWLERCPATLVVASVVFSLPTYLFMEYGTIAFLFALMGYAVRSDQMTPMRGWTVAGVGYALYIAVMMAAFEFTRVQDIFMIVSTGTVMAYLGHFKHRPIAWRVPGERFMVWLSRHSMQYYVIHRFVLQGVGLAKGALKYGPKVMEI